MLDGFRVHHAGICSDDVRRCVFDRRNTDCTKRMHERIEEISLARTPQKKESKKEECMLRRLILICHEDEKITAHAFLSYINNPVEMCVIKDIRTQQDLESIFSSFSGPKDIHIYLMTDLSSSWMQQILSQSESVIRKRALAVFPVMMGRFNIPSNFFSSLPIITSTGDINDLSRIVSEVIKNYLRIDFGKINPWSFENLVKDVLKTYHFEDITLMYSDHVDFGYDMMCTYCNKNEPEANKEGWLVEIKYVPEGRFTIRSVEAVIRQDRGNYLADHKLMLVTNGTFTTAMGDYLRTVIETKRIAIYIVDGWKLSSLIALNNELVEKYFPNE